MNCNPPGHRRAKTDGRGRGAEARLSGLVGRRPCLGVYSHKYQGSGGSAEYRRKELKDYRTTAAAPCAGAALPEPVGFLLELGEGQLRGSIDRDEQAELALF